MVPCRCSRIKHSCSREMATSLKGIREFTSASRYSTAAAGRCGFLTNHELLQKRHVWTLFLRTRRCFNSKRECAIVCCCISGGKGCEPEQRVRAGRMVFRDRRSSGALTPFDSEPSICLSVNVLEGTRPLASTLSDQSGGLTTCLCDWALVGPSMSAGVAQASGQMKSRPGEVFASPS